MLAFLYLASIVCGIPVFEKDILNGAQTNKFGYLNCYLKTTSKFESVAAVLQQDCKQILNLSLLLRPINVAHNPKWLRTTARDLDKTLNMTYLTKHGFPTPSPTMARLYL